MKYRYRIEGGTRHGHGAEVEGAPPSRFMAMPTRKPPHTTEHFLRWMPDDADGTIVYRAGRWEPLPVPDWAWADDVLPPGPDDLCYECGHERASHDAANPRGRTAVICINGCGCGRFEEAPDA